MKNLMNKMAGLLLVLLIVVTFGSFGTYFMFHDKVYNGKEVFYTEQEYAAFKEDVGAKGVNIVEVDVLSSTPPIVVSWAIRTDGVFNYGQRDYSAPIPFFVLSGTALVVGLTWFLLATRE